jgi:hypothetical protein
MMQNGPLPGQDLPRRDALRAADVGADDAGMR